MFDDDVIMFAVAGLKHEDPQWIRAQTQTSAWPQDLIFDLLVMLSDPPDKIETLFPGRRHERHFGFWFPNSPTPPAAAQD
ncbi:hypothetical protein BJF79_01960 [Actinomadura sp. CNU-125]|uniref:hypothetical protein n=1 Tax=Actinomadura sp. CNU-125 TaxID=1904961 RepID=UPI0009661EE4|nr:hypothetical protein [Actinomadura sp. CNU-125]OLT23203.1 hypothetical protein BJF79_01960 [Actinomadura sp. CNU-125]